MLDKTLSHYQILEKLGSGGMGDVFLALDTRLGRRVALKVLPEDVAGSKERRDRFEREARAVAALSHPNILAIYDFGEDHGIAFAVMELLEGETLRAHLSRGALSPQKAIDTTRHIADGLSAAHEKGIVHRDLKPENLFITRDGQVKILDFGLARVAPTPASLAPGSEAETAARLTETGAVLGTVGYMSPEQVKGVKADARSDIFSLGAVFCEMLTGRRAFRGDSAVETLNAILKEDPEEIPATVPNATGLTSVARRCLEKNPEERFQSARDFRFALDALSGITTPVVKKRNPLRFAAATFGLLAVVASSILVYRYVVPPGPGRPESEEAMRIVVLPFENLGPQEDEYFAGGMTEEITSRLAVVNGLGVISRNSALQYVGARKSTKQIGEELGVGYILEGTVRWEKDASGRGRVRVTPQLIRVSDDTHVWAERYDRVVEEVFEVQSEIAEKVASELNLALLAPERRAIETRPTENLEAYQAYLRGVHDDSGPDRVSQRVTSLVVQMFERAVALDPSFALAHARLSQAHSNFYRFGYDRTEERLAKARNAAERSLEIDPDLAWGHLARGLYFYTLTDYERALDELAVAQKGMPGDGFVHFAIAVTLRRQGKLEEALETCRKAADLDPRAPDLWRECGHTLALSRNYEEATRYFDLSIALAPDQITAYSQKANAQVHSAGDLGKARMTLEKMPDTGDPDFVIAWLRQETWERDYERALARAQSMPFEALVTQYRFHPKALVLAELHRLLEESGLARAKYEEAKLFLEREIEKRPDDARVHSALGLTFAGLGRKDEATREASLAVDLLPLSKDAMVGPYPLEDLARVYTLVGEADRALDTIERLLSMKSQLSVKVLELDPAWDPLREHPRYRAILEKFSR